MDYLSHPKPCQLRPLTQYSISYTSNKHSSFRILFRGCNEFGYPKNLGYSDPNLDSLDSGFSIRIHDLWNHFRYLSRYYTVRRYLDPVSKKIILKTKILKIEHK